MPVAGIPMLPIPGTWSVVLGIAQCSFHYLYSVLHFVVLYTARYTNMEVIYSERERWASQVGPGGFLAHIDIVGGSSCCSLV